MDQIDRGLVVHPFRALGAGVREHAQDLPDRDLSRGRWRKTTQPQCLAPGHMVRAQRFALAGLVAFQVLKAQVAGARGLCHTRDDGLRHGAFVQDSTAFLGHAAQHMGVFRIAQHMPHRQGLSVGGVEVAGCHRVGFQ